MKLDFNDEVDEREKEGKKKKATVQKSRVKVIQLCGVSLCHSLQTCHLDYRSERECRRGETEDSGSS